MGASKSKSDSDQIADLAQVDRMGNVSHVPGQE